MKPSPHQTKASAPNPTPPKGEILQTEMAQNDIAQANIEFSSGHPRSLLHNDNYYDLGNGLEESRYVFFEQGQVAEVWQQGQELTVYETGFGTGLNFLMIWQEWIRAGRPGPFHFYSVEKYPLSLQQAKACHAVWQPILGTWIAELQQQWPPTQKGWQNGTFEDGQIQLQVFQGDVLEALPHWPLQKQPDVWFLDGFAPAQNPDLWCDELFDFMGQTAKEGTRFSTFTAAGFVRRALAQRGFAVEKVRGFGKKREMLRGSFSASS